jgi:hypothetical protein
LPGGIAQPLQGTAQRKQSKIEDGRQAASAEGAQSLTASTPWHDEGSSKTASLAPPTRLIFGKRSAQFVVMPLGTMRLQRPSAVVLDISQPQCGALSKEAGKAVVNVEGLRV